MPCLLLFILIAVSMNVSIGLDNNSIMKFGVQYPNHIANGPGCGINYKTNTIYFVGGILNSNENNPDYITWNALESTDWINNNDYSNIVSPSFRVTPIKGNTLSTIPGYNNSEWFCEFVECTAQINQNPYIYIVGPNVNVRNDINPRETSSMLIYDMDSNNYIESTKYKYTVPGVAKTGSCVTSDGTYLYVIGGTNDVTRIVSTVYRYTPPSSGDYVSNTADDKWELMGNMRYSLYGRGCTTDKLSRYLYMIGGYNGSISTSNAEYIDLNEYELNGFNDSYYDMGPIIDREFRNNNPEGWVSPNCFSSQYASDIIYCGGGSIAERFRIPTTKEIWTFSRLYSPEYYKNGSILNISPQIYGCSQPSSNFNEYFYYPKCAGIIGHNINKYLGSGLQYNNIVYAPRDFTAGCNTPWYSVNTNFSIRFYLGMFIPRNNPLIIKEDSNMHSFDPSIAPTMAPSKRTTFSENATDIPTLNPTETSSDTDNITSNYSKNLIIIVVIIILLLLTIITAFIIHKYYMRVKGSQISEKQQKNKQTIQDKLNNVLYNIKDLNITSINGPNIIPSIDDGNRNINELQIEGDNRYTTHSPVINVKTKNVT